MQESTPLLHGPKGPTARSRITNHRDLLPGIDGRSQKGRRYRDILLALVADQGGLDRLSEARVSLSRRFSALSVMAEAIEADLINGAQIDIAEFATIASTLVRLAARIGLNRRAKVVPELADYLESRAEIEPPERADEEDGDDT
jgi:hypothetical protein